MLICPDRLVRVTAGGDVDEGGQSGDVAQKKTLKYNVHFVSS